MPLKEEGRILGKGEGLMQSVTKICCSLAHFVSTKEEILSHLSIEFLLIEFGWTERDGER